MTHFYRRCAGAQNGEPPPLSPPQRRGTTGQINEYFKVSGLFSLQALTYPECRTAALILPAHPGPFPAIGKGGGGKGQIRPWLPWERFCAQYGLIFGSRHKSIRIQHSQRQGSWGTAPSVFWYGAPGGTQGPLGKGGAAERWRVAYPIGIATRHGAKPATTHTSKRNATAVAVQTKLPKTLSPPSGARKLFHPTQKQLTTLPLHQGLNGKQNCFT